MVERKRNMITLPTTAGWIVEYETTDISKITGKAIWREALCTKSKESADKKSKELEEKGLRVRVLEAIF